MLLFLFSANFFIHLVFVEHVQGTSNIVVNKIGDILAVTDLIYRDAKWGSGSYTIIIEQLIRLDYFK